MFWRKLISVICVSVLSSVVVMAQDGADGEIVQPELRYICNADDDCTWTPLSQEDLDFVDPDNTYEEAEPPLEGAEGERFVCVETIGCEWSPLSDDDLEVGLGDLDYWIADINDVPEGDWAFSDISTTECDLAMMNVETISSGEMTLASIDDDGTRLQLVVSAQMDEMAANAAVAGMTFNFTEVGDQGSTTVALGGAVAGLEYPVEVEDGQGSMLAYRIGPGTYTTGVIGIYDSQDGGESFVTWESYFSLVAEGEMRGFTIINSNFAADGMGFSCLGNVSLEATAIEGDE